MDNIKYINNKEPLEAHDFIYEQFVARIYYIDNEIYFHIGEVPCLLGSKYVLTSGRIYNTKYSIDFLTRETLKNTTIDKDQLISKSYIYKNIHRYKIDKSKINKFKEFVELLVEPIFIEPSIISKNIKIKGSVEEGE